MGPTIAYLTFVFKYLLHRIYVKQITEKLDQSITFKLNHELTVFSAAAFRALKYRTANQAPKSHIP